MSNRKGNFEPFEKPSIIQRTEQYSREIVDRVTSAFQRREQYARDVAEYGASLERATYLTDTLARLTEGKRTPLKQVQHFRSVLNQAQVELPRHQELLESHHMHIDNLPKLDIPSIKGIFPINKKEGD